MKQLHTKEVENQKAEVKYPRLQKSVSTECIYLMTDNSTGTRLTGGVDVLPVGAHSDTLANLKDYSGSVELDMR